MRFGVRRTPVSTALVGRPRRRIVPQFPLAPWSQTPIVTAIRGPAGREQGRRRGRRATDARPRAGRTYPIPTEGNELLKRTMKRAAVTAAVALHRHRRLRRRQRGCAHLPTARGPARDTLSKLAPNNWAAVAAGGIENPRPHLRRPGHRPRPDRRRDELGPVERALLVDYDEPESAPAEYEAAAPLPPPSPPPRPRGGQHRLRCLGPARPVRVRRQLVDQHRQRLLRRPAVLAEQLGSRRWLGQPGQRLP